MYRGPGRSNSGRKSAGPHLLYFAGSEVDREAGNRVWSSDPWCSSRMHEPTPS